MTAIATLSSEERGRMYLRYLCQIIRHKWFVFVECCRFGIPWLGIIHDWSKFLPSEFIPYARYFYGDNKRTGQKTWTEYEFNLAWLHHQHRNKHHWQRWVVRLDHPQNRELLFYPMPEKYLKEMLADWIGAGKAYGNPNTREWYLKNMGKMQLNPETRYYVEKYLGLR